MRIHKTGKDNSSADIDLLYIARFRQLLYVRGRPDCCDQTIADEESAVFHEAQIG
jgi:hypothetical protein